MRMRGRLARISNGNLETCIHWLLSGIPVTEDSLTSPVAKRTMEEDRSQCCCAMSMHLDSSHTCWWDRMEPWPTASYIPSHTAIAELVTVAGLFLNASGPSPHCFLNPYSSYAELLTTHPPWRLPTPLCIYTTLSCCTVPLPPAKPSWMVCVMCSSILSSSEPNKVADTATPWTARVRVNVAHTSTSSVVKLRGHSYYHRHLFPSWFLRFFTCSYITPLNSSSTTRLQRHIPTCHFRKSSSRPSCE